MGNEESFQNEQVLTVSPTILKIRNALNLNINSNKTSSFVNQQFTQKIKKASGEISRVNNPFCPLLPQDPNDKQQNWLCCCLVSPVMAIASPRLICDQKGKYLKKVKIQALTKKQGYIQLPIEDIILIKPGAICLLLLSKPNIKLGWAGITCLNNKEQIQTEPFKFINHPRSGVDSQKKVMTYEQEINKAFYKSEKQFVGKYKAMPGSLIFRTIDKKPHIIGIQISQSQAQFISKDTLQRINHKARQIMTPKVQRQILSAIDIQELQLMEKL